MSDRRETVVNVEREPNRPAYVETRSSNTGVWAGVIVVVLVLAFVAFFFLRPASDTASTGTDVRIENSAPVEQPSAPPAAAPAPDSAAAPAAPAPAAPDSGSTSGSTSGSSDASSSSSEPAAPGAAAPAPAPAPEPAPAQQ